MNHPSRLLFLIRTENSSPHHNCHLPYRIFATISNKDAALRKEKLEMTPTNTQFSVKRWFPHCSTKNWNLSRKGESPCCYKAKFCIWLKIEEVVLKRWGGAAVQ